MKTHTFLIGFGNRLRGDDGLGPAAAEIVASWHSPGVRTLVIPQLVPELVDEIACVQRVLFLDAGRHDQVDAYEITSVDARKSRRSLGHHETPANLLAMVAELEGKHPAAWMLAIKPVSFDFGAGLSEDAARHLQAALTWIRLWLEEPICTKSA